MFKIFHIDNSDNEHEVLPGNGIYVVYDLYEYKFKYKGSISETTIFIEDEALDYSFMQMLE
jgi:hypothetical protein